MPDHLTIHIYPGDCDTAGHVNHAIMLTLLERARWAALEKHMAFQDYIRRSQWAVVRHVDVSYSNPSLPGDDFIVKTGLETIGNTSFTVRQVATNQKGALVRKKPENVRDLEDVPGLRRWQIAEMGEEFIAALRS